MSEPSSKAHKSQERFFSALRDLFVGAKVEGESGFINLMRIKSRYYTDVFPKLQSLYPRDTKGTRSSPCQLRRS